MLTKLIYNISIAIYGALIYITSPFYPKARKWVKGRKGLFQSLEAWSDKNSRRVIWIHVASLGEYEQAKPLIHKIKQERPQYAIACTFFSPSGYEHIEKDHQLDWIGYLPIDRKSVMHKFISIMNPEKVFIVRYDWWWNMLQELIQQRCEIYFINAVFRKDKYFIRYQKSFFNDIIGKINKIYVINEASYQAINKPIFNNIHIAGDTKLHQALANAKAPFKDDILAQYHQCIIYGSIWQSDIDHLGAEAFDESHNHILFPHNISPQNINKIKSKFKTADIYSEFKEKKSHILIVDQIGMLKYAYRYADRAYIGGAYEDGLHNILEAAVYKIPIACGNHSINLYSEAEALKKYSILHPIENSRDIDHFNRVSFDESQWQIYLNVQENPIDVIFEEIFS